MSRIPSILRAALAAALLAGLPARAAPPQVMTYSGYLKNASGGPVTTATSITFRLYTAQSGGASVWSETVSVTPSADGWFSAVIGTMSSLPFSILNQDLYLSLQVGADPEFNLRARVTPSHAALTVDWGGVQGKPTCAPGAYLTLDGIGNLACTTPSTGTGGITSVSGSRGITATTTGSSVSLTLPLCATTGDIMRWDGTSWGCSAPASSGVTSVSAAASTPISVVNTGGAVQLSMNAASGSAPGYLAAADYSRFDGKLTAPSGCTTGQAIVNQAGAWSCTSVSGPVGIASPLVNSGTTAAPVVALPSCATGEVLKYTGPAPTTWTCQPDSVGAGTVTAVTATAPLTATTGPTPNVALPTCATGSILLSTASGWECHPASLVGAGASATVTTGTSGSTLLLFGPSVTPPWRGSCTFTSRLFVLAVGSLTAYVQTFGTWRVGTTTYDSGYVTPLQVEPALGAGMATETWSFPVTAGTTYEIGCRIILNSDTAGKTAYCRATYHCTPN
ncbi:MAG: hypothetical protein HZB56_10460 [Deltaproteobacteria bacterium]|nr:hypothetical protein [Deltaproteobacteria bacterium]